MKFPAVHQGEDDLLKSLYGQKKLQVEKQTILLKMADFELHNMVAGGFFFTPKGEFYGSHNYP